MFVKACVPFVVRIAKDTGSDDGEHRFLVRYKGMISRNKVLSRLNTKFKAFFCCGFILWRKVKILGNLSWL